MTPPPHTPSDDDELPDVIRFYSVSGEYGFFSNFAPYPVRIGGKDWPTSEHYFQAQKFLDRHDQEAVRKIHCPVVAARMARNPKKHLRDDWDMVKDSVMREAVRAKFTQHEALREALLSTGDVRIVEHTDKDTYWGDGGDGTGANMLGKILMEIRPELKEAKLQDEDDQQQVADSGW